MNPFWRIDAETILSKYTQRPVRNYSTYDFGREKDTDAISILMPEDDAYDLLTELREDLPPGLVAFIGTTNNLADEDEDGVEVVVAPGESQFDILVMARSDAVNFDMATGDLIKKLQEYDRRYGIDIFQAETDTIQFVLLTMPFDLDGFVKDLYDFCPDVVDQGVGSIEELKKLVKDTQQIFLWWD